MHLTPCIGEEDYDVKEIIKAELQIVDIFVTALRYMNRSRLKAITIIPAMSP